MTTVDVVPPWGGARARAWSREVLATKGTRCVLRYPGRCTIVATEGDHIVPRSVDLSLQYEVSNGQPACRSCNAYRKAKPNPTRPVVDDRDFFERRPRGIWTRTASPPAATKKSPDRAVFVVTGPPCSGKTTYVDENAQPGDVIVDFDAIARRLGSPVTHRHPYYPYGRDAEREVGRLVDEIAAGLHPRAWVIRGWSDPDRVSDLVEQLDAEHVDLADAVDVDELRRRAMARPDPEWTVEQIEQWHG